MNTEENKNMSSQIKTLTAQIVTAYLTSHEVASEALPGLITSVHTALAEGPAQTEPDKPVPAVPPRKSVFPDFIICLEDGRKLKMLRRHLKTTYNMTPQEYRTRWGLPDDYPMNAPNHSKNRSAIARNIGLGRRISA